MFGNPEKTTLFNSTRSAANSCASSLAMTALPAVSSTFALDVLTVLFAVAVTAADNMVAFTSFASAVIADLIGEEVEGGNNTFDGVVATELDTFSTVDDDNTRGGVRIRVLRVLFDWLSPNISSRKLSIENEF